MIRPEDQAALSLIRASKEAQEAAITAKAASYVHQLEQDQRLEGITYENLAHKQAYKLGSKMVKYADKRFRLTRGPRRDLELISYIEINGDRYENAKIVRSPLMLAVQGEYIDGVTVTHGYEVSAVTTEARNNYEARRKLARVSLTACMYAEETGDLRYLDSMEYYFIEPDRYVHDVELIDSLEGMSALEEVRTSDIVHMSRESLPTYSEEQHLDACSKLRLIEETLF